METNEKSEKIYDSAKLINPFVDEINSLFENRFILKRMIYTNFKTRYKRSYLGVIWSLLNPLLNMVVFVVIFSNLFRFDIPHYPLYIFAGNMIFSFYSSSTAEAMMQNIGNGPMIRRVYLPKTVYVISGIGINGINLILTAIPFIIIAFIDKVEYSSALFLIIPAILLLTFFVVGMSLLVATITTYLNDFSQIWSVILTLWMYLTPLFYPETIIPDEFIVAFRLNPMYIFVTLFRDPVLYQKIPDPVLWINGSLYGFGVLILGWWIFTKHSNDFAYRA